LWAPHRHSIAFAESSRIRLLLRRTGVIHVTTAIIIAQGKNMTTSTTENEQTAQATTAATEKPEPPKKAHAAARSRHVAPSKPKSGKKTTPAKKGAKRAKVPEKATGARPGSKTEKVVDLLKRPGGVTTKELIKATGWQPHSVRGFLSGTVGKKMGLAVTSTKGEDGERSYSVKS
jgi:cobalamin biosynthesis protein CobT